MAAPLVSRTEHLEYEVYKIAPILIASNLIGRTIAVKIHSDTLLDFEFRSNLILSK